MAFSRAITQTVEECPSPDTEENVREQTESIVRNFMYQRHIMEMQSETSTVAISTPRIPEFQNFTANPMSPTSQVGRRLAQIGDQINTQYEGEFRQMIQALHITPSTAYQAFAGVARRLFTKGINWGRIAALLMFGYRIAMEFTRSVGDFLRKILQLLVQFIITERIAEWIAQQGGWASALNFRLENPSWKTFAAVAALAGTAAVVAIWWSKSR